MSSEMYCTTRTLKYIVHVLNLLLSILGILLTWFGFWLLNGINEANIDHGENLGAIVTILLGFATVTIAIFGCIATYFESRRYLISYAVLLVVLLAIQFILLSLSYVAAKAGFADDLNKGFEELWDENIQTNSSLSYYEQWLQCCGRNSAEDYLLVDKIPPSSCCKDRDCTQILNLYVTGCEPRFKEYIQSKTSNFNTMSYFLILTEFTGSVLACVLIDSIKNHKDRVRFYS